MMKLLKVTTNLLSLLPTSPLQRVDANIIMLESLLRKLGLATPLALVVLMHGVAAYVFAAVFLLEACGYSFPLFSLGWQHPTWIHSPYTRSAC